MDSGDDEPVVTQPPPVTAAAASTDTPTDATALPKQAIRKVIQQTTGQQVSQPVAQIVAGVAKVFVGEIVEKARQVQSRRNDSGPLTPDHLREAYRMYQAETGRVGSARPMRGKRLFVR
ncbi:histone-fold-containing protein [Suillus subaureus]|uniref:Histone-fold-containing protein n=1 Tax=Suillus subaureus TaxID=48587 RepID=A0A9P7DG22_9AGAM|nr:histone-fold-containing protein [Suillus subaureus]KAG1791131.1 histone-fold-containing protein [Suillus subaureus]